MEAPELRDLAGEPDANDHQATAFSSIPSHDAEASHNEPRDEDQESLMDADGYVHWKMLDEQTEEERKALMNNSVWIGLTLFLLAVAIMFAIMFGVYVVSAIRYGW